MQTAVRTVGTSALIGLVVIFLFMIVEVVNRRSYNEDFPFMLFFVMWLNLFAISLILTPIVRAWQTRRRDTSHPDSTQRNMLLSNPIWAAIIGVAVFLTPWVLSLLNSLGWLPLDRLLNGPNPEQPYLPGQLVELASFAIPVAAGIIAGRPVAGTLRSGGSLFAHPINLIVVVLIVSAIGVGLADTIIDQWPCFMGVPNCD